MRHYFLLTNSSTGGKIQFIFHLNWMMTVFSLHISATLHLTMFGIWSNNIQSVQYVICVMNSAGVMIYILVWQYNTQYELLLIYVHHWAPFCVLTVKRRASLVVLELSIIRLLQYDWLSGYWRCNMCDWNPVSEYIFNFFMATYECMHSKYGCRVCKYLFCIHAKLYKHISPNYYKPDVQSLKFCWRCSYWIFSQLSIQGFHKF